MPIIKKISLALVAGSIAFGTLGASSQANAAGLTTQEKVFLAGAGGFVLGAIIGSHNRHGHAVHVNSWQRHVNRCYARYASYNEHTDTYLSYSGYEKRCRL